MMKKQRAAMVTKEILFPLLAAPELRPEKRVARPHGNHFRMLERMVRRV
jgi:hypothetical protein